MELNDKIMEKQATLNIGIIGHVAHGKSTLVNAISGIKTVRFKTELEKNITIKLGYANTKILKCPICPRPDCYKSYKSTISNKLQCPNENCEGIMELVRHVSFVDCPGHDVLMATMISGTAIMDAAILLIAANEYCPQPQTREHLFALERTDISKILVVQNKIDLITREKCLEQYDTIQKFLKNTRANNSPVVPVSGQYKLNISAVLDYIVNYFEPAERDLDAPPKMVIIRSFDINKPGFKINALNGGVIGGSLLCGKLKLGDIIEIRPGVIKRVEGKVVCIPYITKVISLKTEQTELEEGFPGGLIGIGTELDPSICIADSLVGQVLGLKGKLSDIYDIIEVKYELSDQMAGLRGFLEESCDYLLNIGSSSLNATFLRFNNKHAVFEISRPVCCDINDKIAISQRLQGNWRLVGYGTIIGGNTVKVLYEEKDVFTFEELKNKLSV